MLTSVAVITGAFSVSDSFSQLELFDFSEIMKQNNNDGYTTITASGESSTTLQPDSAILMIEMFNAPTDLQNAIDSYDNKMSNISEEIKNDLDNFDDVTVSYIHTNFEGEYYGYGVPRDGSDSYVAYMSFPIKTDMKNYQNISQEISELGLAIDDIRIKRVPVPVENDDDSKDDMHKILIKPVPVSIPYGTSVPECEISNECFLPAEITVDVGTEVIWSNDDEAAHTVTSGDHEDGPDGYFDSGLFMAGDTFSYAFDLPGEYPYFCMVHPWMTGTIIVAGEPKDGDMQYMLEATIQVKLETSPDTLENTLSTYNDTIDKVTALLETHGIAEDIPKSTIDINPAHYRHGGFAPTSYQTYQRLAIKTPLDNLEEINQIITKYGGVQRISLFYSESSVESVKKELTQFALEDARRNVSDLIEPMDMELKGIKNIKINQISNSDNRHNSQMMYKGVFVSMDDWNHVRDGNITVLVDVEFEVGPK